jgi:hypothetical protein
MNKFTTIIEGILSKIDNTANKTFKNVDAAAKTFNNINDGISTRLVKGGEHLQRGLTDQPYRDDTGKILYEPQEQYDHMTNRIIGAVTGRMYNFKEDLNKAYNNVMNSNSTTKPSNEILVAIGKTINDFTQDIRVGVTERMKNPVKSVGVTDDQVNTSL